MYESRPQIKSFLPSTLPNDYHLELYTTMANDIIDAEYTVDNPAPALLAPCIDAFKLKLTAENGVYAVSTTAPQTKDIARLDSERDPILRQMKDVIRTMAAMDIMPEKKAAALLLQESMKPYPYLDPNAEYEAETNAINQWNEAIQASQELTAAIAALGLTDALATLVSKTAEMKALMVERANQQSEQTKAALQTARQETDAAWTDVQIVQNALEITDAHPERFQALILHLNEQIDHYRELAEARRKQNRKVTVKSTVVGNHQYQPSSGWTWAQLTAKYPKLLALDPEPSAPGVEPVVTAQRIVSAEKKAQQAGGLAVALNGVLVKPTDVVDVEKEHELIPYSAQPEPSGDDQGGGSDSGEVTPVTPE